jgi:hypothetical protein
MKAFTVKVCKKDHGNRKMAVPRPIQFLRDFIYKKAEISHRLVCLTHILNKTFSFKEFIIKFYWVTHQV